MHQLARSVAFEYLAHLVVVPVTAGGVETRFVFDSGIGLTLVSGSLADRLGCGATGRVFTGRRMSGQEVSVPLATLDSLELGGYRRSGLTVGIFDLGVPGLEGIDGFLSLDYFRDAPVTVDYGSQHVAVGERPPGVPVAVHVDRDGPSTTVYMPLELPSGRTVSVEVDMGSDDLILDERFAAELGVDLDDASVRRVEGRDETGHEYVRRFTSLSGVVRVPTAPQLAQRDPGVMFQKIVYEGLVGQSFLRNFAVTFDLPNERLIFSTLSA
jgi:Aspartyl protease